MSDAAVRLFKQDRMLFDEGGLLTAGGRRMVRGKVVVIEEQTGRKAHVWTLTKGASLAPLQQVYADVGFDPAGPLRAPTRDFAADRLAAGADALRTLWWSAWLESAGP